MHIKSRLHVFTVIMWKLANNLLFSLKKQIGILVFSWSYQQSIVQIESKVPYMSHDSHPGMTCPRITCMEAQNIFFHISRKMSTVLPLDISRVIHMSIMSKQFIIKSASSHNQVIQFTTCRAVSCVQCKHMYK